MRTSPGSAIRNLKVVTSKHKMMNYGPAKLMKQQFIQDDGTIKDSLTSHEEVKYVLLVKDIRDPRNLRPELYRNEAGVSIISGKYTTISESIQSHAEHQQAKYSWGLAYNGGSRTKLENGEDWSSSNIVNLPAAALKRVYINILANVGGDLAEDAEERREEDAEREEGEVEQFRAGLSDQEISADEVCKKLVPPPEIRNRPYLVQQGWLRTQRARMMFEAKQNSTIPSRDKKNSTAIRTNADRFNQ